MHRDHNCIRRHSREATGLPWFSGSSPQTTKTSPRRQQRNLSACRFSTFHPHAITSFHGAQRRTLERVSGPLLCRSKLSPVSWAKSRVQFVKKTLLERPPSTLDNGRNQALLVQPLEPILRPCLPLDKPHSPKLLVSVPFLVPAWSSSITQIIEIFHTSV
jgi:hypothetical protein